MKTSINTKIKAILAIALINLFIGCQSKSEQMKPEFNLNEVKEYINKANKDYGKRSNGELAFFNTNYTKDAWVMPAGVSKITGVDNIIKYFTPSPETPPFNVLVKSTEIFGNEDHVIETGIYELIFKSGETFDKGKFIVVWKQEDGIWKIHREIWTSDLPQQ